VKLKNTGFFYTIIAFSIVFAGCAKMGSITGGTKDIIPPKVISAKPENYSNNFESEKIEIEFSEFIQLKNVNQELIISPPLPKKPTIRIKNKSLLIELNNELRENTTYTLNFGKAIADNNEGNPLTNYEYVFSTGEFLDSLSVQGILLNSFNLLPSKEPFIVGIYDLMEDSVPLKSIPIYIGKTDDKGHFMINNIKEDTFKVFALKDMNSNLIFDLPTEEIGYSDTLLMLNPEFLRTLPKRLMPVDTTRLDTLNLGLDEPNTKPKKLSKKEQARMAAAALDSAITAKADSIEFANKLPELFIDLVYFLPEASKQYLSNSERVGKEYFKVSFSLPLAEDPGIKSINLPDTGNWYFPEINATRDTFIYWLRDTSFVKSDSLRFAITYPVKDSVGEYFAKTDTLKFFSRPAAPKTTTSRGGKNKTEVKIPEVKLLVGSIRNRGMMELNANIPLSFNFPLQQIDTSLVRLSMMEDSVEVSQKYSIIADSVNVRKAEMRASWKEKGKYKMMMLPGAFTDIYSHTNDTIEISFSVQEKAFYGSLLLTLSEVKSPVLVQLMSEKETVLKTKLVTNDGLVVFDYLLPAKYKVKFVYDNNENSKWDTGDYLKKKQPEKVSYYEGEINIRSNWDLGIKHSFGE